MINWKTPFYLAALGLFLLGKALADVPDIEQLTLLLFPVSKFIHFFTGVAPVYTAAEGYTFEPLGIVINAGCSGIQFFLMAYGLLQLLTIHRLQKASKIAASFPLVLLAVYVMTLLVNSVRITGAIYLADFSNQLPDYSHWAHGLLVYMLSLISAVFVFDKLLPQNPNSKSNKTPAQ